MDIYLLLFRVLMKLNFNAHLGNSMLSKLSVSVTKCPSIAYHKYAQQAQTRQNLARSTETQTEGK